MQLAGAAFIAVGFWAWSEKVSVCLVMSPVLTCPHLSSTVSTVPTCPHPFSPLPTCLTCLCCLQGVLLDLTQVTRLHGFDPVWLVLAVGGVTFTLGFAGCVGALRENICLLKFVRQEPSTFCDLLLGRFFSFPNIALVLRRRQFSGVIGFIFVLELTAAVLAVVFQSQVKAWINDFFLANIKAYRDDIDLQNLIDSLQRMVIGSDNLMQHLSSHTRLAALTLCVCVCRRPTEPLLRRTRTHGLEHERLLQLR